ncbi:T-complex protein 1 subunit beta [Tanacetum coccineum]
MTNIPKWKDDQVRTASVIVLSDEVEEEVKKLLAMKIHPKAIIEGFHMAFKCARIALLERVKYNKKQDSDLGTYEIEFKEFRSDLIQIARTILNSKIPSQDLVEHFATLVVDAVKLLKDDTNLDSINIIKKAGGSLKDSFLVEGYIEDIENGIELPKRIENATILFENTTIDTDIGADSAEKGAQIFDAGSVAIEHAVLDGIKRLDLVTGGEVASTFDNPEFVKLGEYKFIKEIMIGEDKVINFAGIEMGQAMEHACTIVLRGASSHVLDETKRSLHDALCVVCQTINDGSRVLGGGWPEMIMAKAVDELARKTPGEESHAIAAFSRALLAIPTTIADNAGLDSAALIAQLQAEHHKENSNAGIDVITGSVRDMSELGISEALRVKLSILRSAPRAAAMCLSFEYPRHSEGSFPYCEICTSSCRNSGNVLSRKGIGLHTSTELESGEVDITSSKIVKWKILRHGGKGYCQPHHSKSKGFSTNLLMVPIEDLESAFAENLRIMFDPPQSEDTVWSLPMHIPIVNWRYYDSCNVRGWEYEVRVSRVLEADVARCHWWIQLVVTRRRLEVMIGVRGWEYEVSRRLRGMLSLVDPAVKSWRTRYAEG